MFQHPCLTIALLASWLGALVAAAAGPVGYYRQPAIHGDTIVFVAEGDLWRVGTDGGKASRLTSHLGEEASPAISPDGQAVAFVASYEGPTEVYTMPLAGGLPVRRSYDGDRKIVSGFAPDGKLLYGTTNRCTLPGMQLMLLDVSQTDVTATGTMVPLWQAAEGCFDDAGQQLFFTRFLFQGSQTKRYVGGTAQNLWRYDGGDAEAVPLTSKYPGTSKSPMWWSGRVYFESDRDNIMNIWSMKPDGSDVRQHTHHQDWDVMQPSMHAGRIVYQLGADLHLFDVTADRDRLIPITLDSDLDQTREHWIKRPGEYMTSAHLSANGDKVVITARGQVFVAPREKGRLIKITRRDDVRCRNARFMPDGKSLLALSDQSGEVEVWKLPASGIGEFEQLTTDANILRWETLPSPDGKYIAHHDKNRRLFLYDVEAKKNRQIDESKGEDFSDLTWSSDSKWLAYVGRAANQFQQIRLFGLDDGSITEVTSDRFESYSPAWSSDGKWLYFLSDRNLHTIVPSPWGNYQPEPYMDKRTEIYAVALTKAEVRSPFAPSDELHVDKKAEATTKPGLLQRALSAMPKGGGRRGNRAAKSEEAEEPKPEGQPESQPTSQPTTEPASKPAVVARKFDLEGIQSRVIRVPVGPGNYDSLEVNEKALFWISRARGERAATLQALEISRESPEVKTVTSGISRYEMSQDGKKLLIQKRDEEGDPEDRGAGPAKLYIVDASAAPADLAKKGVDLSRWSLSVIPRLEWRQMFTEAWRLERDYFYDPGMHGVDWKAVLAKYQPLVDRVTDRAELSDLLAQMVAELSALHIFVRGGDQRNGDDHVTPASLGAVLERAPQGGGYQVKHIYQSDRDEPEAAGPLGRPDVDIQEGDVIERVNGVDTLGVPDIGMLLRGQAGLQVLLHVKPAAGGEGRDVLVTAISADTERNLRYNEWEYTRRLAVEKLGHAQIGYVHLRAMQGGNFTEWAKGYYPNWNRQGLIIDVRNNNGGNIDSWIIDRLLRKAWFYWGNRLGPEPIYSMQHAFQGHIAVLCNERTMSDGEAFCDGIQRLKIGKVIGNRTWGGAIWLSFSNTLVDRGIATAAENGTYAPTGNWLIEGHGIDPDMVVENLPHATYQGRDEQLEVAIKYLQQRIAEEPIKLPPLPKFPNKSRLTFSESAPSGE